MSNLRFLSVSAAALLVPGLAHAHPKLTPTVVFLDASPSMKLIMVMLVAASVGAIVVAVRKVLSGPRLSGGSAYLQALRLGGPLIGLLGAAWNLMMSNLAIANVGQQPPYHVLAPGVAEAAFLFVLGLIAGVIAVICNWIVEARIDRAVLRP